MSDEFDIKNIMTKFRFLAGIAEHLSQVIAMQPPEAIMYYGCDPESGRTSRMPYIHSASYAAEVQKISDARALWEKYQANEDKKPCGVSLVADWDVIEKLEADTLRLMVVDLQNSIGRLAVEQRAKQAKQAEWQSLEKQHSRSLERLAQLCYAICPWVLSNSPEIVPIEVATASAEIMNYIGTVKPQ